MGKDGARNFMVWWHNKPPLFRFLTAGGFALTSFALVFLVAYVEQTDKGTLPFTSLISREKG